MRIISHLLTLALLTAPCLGGDRYGREQNHLRARSTTKVQTSEQSSFVDYLIRSDNKDGRYNQFLSMYDNQDTSPEVKDKLFEFAFTVYHLLSEGPLFSTPEIQAQIEDVAGPVEELGSGDYTELYQGINKELQDFWTLAASHDESLPEGTDFTQRVVGVRGEVVRDFNLMFEVAKLLKPDASTEEWASLADEATSMAAALDNDALLSHVEGTARLYPVPTIFYGDGSLERDTLIPTLSKEFDNNFQREVTHVHLFGFGLTAAIGKTANVDYDFDTQVRLAPDEPVKTSIFQELALGYFFGHQSGRNMDSDSVGSVFNFWQQRNELFDSLGGEEEDSPHPSTRNCAQVFAYHLAKADGSELRSPLDLWNLLNQEDGLMEKLQSPFCEVAWTSPSLRGSQS